MAASDKKKIERIGAGASGGRSATVSKLGDTGSRKLAKLQNAVGNETLTQRLQEGNSKRDGLIAFVTERLREIRKDQLKELAELQPDRRTRDWRKIADEQKEQYQERDPTRWVEVARRYERVVQHLCHGELSRAVDLLEDAHRLEQEVRQELPRNVKGSRDAGELPDLEVGAAEATGDGDAPEAKQLAHEIQLVTTVQAELPNKKRGADPWWTLEEEEEEEENDEGDG